MSGGLAIYDPSSNLKKGMSDTSSLATKILTVDLRNII